MCVCGGKGGCVDIRFAVGLDPCERSRDLLFRPTADPQGGGLHRRGQSQRQIRRSLEQMLNCCSLSDEPQLDQPKTGSHWPITRK